MSGRLHNGVLHDAGWNHQSNIAMDGMPVTVDEALTASREQAKEQTPLEKLIPGFGRLR
jgi:hypothetical protein